MNMNLQNNLHISVGNTKTGAIPSFSLPSGKTCSREACKTCFQQGCYARKIERLRPNVRKNYEENLALMTQRMEDAEAELNAYFNMPNATRLFRIHVSGDFYSEDYFRMWMRVAAAHPGTQFLAFTKQVQIIRPYLDKLPKNLSLVWSAWPGSPVPKDVRKALPVAWMQDGTEKRMKKNAMECPGNCESCGMCWALGGMDVVFKKH